MPEGPEVIITVQYLKSELLDKYISSYNILSGRYKRFEIKGNEYFKTRKKYKITDINSKGKFIWFTLEEIKTNNVVYMTSTLGMSGIWGFEKSKSTRLTFNIIDTPKITKKTNKYKLYFTDQRNFGELRFYNDMDELQKRLDKLAPDILKDSLSTEDIVDLIDNLIDNRRMNKNLVKILMNQKALVSGIGNYLVAEILYHAKLDPHRDLEDLTNNEKKKLAYAMRYISKLSYYYNKTGYMINFMGFMDDHTDKIDKRIFPNYHPDIKLNDKEFEFKVYNQDFDPKGNEVQTDSIVKGRKIHWVPAVQN